jgi:hypothetical protein
MKSCGYAPDDDSIGVRTMPSATIADHDIEVVATGGLMSAAPSLKLGKHCDFPVIRCGMVAPASKNNNRFCFVDWKTTTRVPIRLIVCFGFGWFLRVYLDLDNTLCCFMTLMVC